MQGEIKSNGTLLWGVLNTLRGSSTRTELGGLIAGVLSDLPAHAGIDNLAVVKGAQKVITHMRKKSRAILRMADGALNLGGRLSPLHRDGPWYKPYTYIKDGDLWQTFVNMIGKRRGKLGVGLERDRSRHGGSCSNGGGATRRQGRERYCRPWCGKGLR